MPTRRPCAADPWTSPPENDFLGYLARGTGRVCTRRMILDNVWRPSYVQELHYLKVYA